MAMTHATGKLSQNPLANILAGSALGALTLTPERGLAAIAVGWGLLMPVLMLLARRFDGINSLSDKIINNQ